MPGSVGQPIHFGIIYGSEHVTVGLPLAQVRAHGLRIAVLREISISASGSGQVIDPIASIALSEQPPPKGLALGFVTLCLVNHVRFLRVEPRVSHLTFVHAMFLPNRHGSVQTPAMTDAQRNWIEGNNWLAHRWSIELKASPYGQWVIHAGTVEGHRIGQAASREDYDLWHARQRPTCLARFIAGRPSVHPAAVLVVAGEYRLGKIPAELWCGYDVTHLLDLPPLTLISAKARAVFPDWPMAMLRVVRQDDVKGLRLKPAPAARGPRLRAVA